MGYKAPGGLEAVRKFVNTLDLEDDTELLADPGAASAWLSDWGLLSQSTSLNAADLERVRSLREAIRGVLLAHNGGEPRPGAIEELNEAGCVALHVRIGADGEASLEPRCKGVEEVLGRVMALVHTAITEGTWERLKACPWHTCEAAFYDSTKNHSKTWCDMAVCGNRAKAKTYRERQVERR